MTTVLIRDNKVVGSANADNIDDSKTTASNVWSAEKVNNEVTKVSDSIGTVPEGSTVENQISAINSTLDNLEIVDGITFTHNQSVISNVEFIRSYSIGRLVTLTIKCTANFSGSGETNIGSLSREINAAVGSVVSWGNTSLAGGCSVVGKNLYLNISNMPADKVLLITLNGRYAN